MTLEHTWLIKNQIQWNDMQVNCLREYNMYNLPPILDLCFIKNTNLLQSFLFVQINSIFCNHIYTISIILIDISLTYKCIHIAWRRNQVLNYSLIISLCTYTSTFTFFSFQFWYSNVLFACWSCLMPRRSW